MSKNIIIAVIGAFINALLSLIVPTLLDRTEEPIVNDIKKLFKLKKELIITSSIIVGITIYLSLELAPTIYNNLYDAFTPSTNNLDDFMYKMQFGRNTPNLNNLVKLQLI